MPDMASSPEYPAHYKKIKRKVPAASQKCLARFKSALTTPQCLFNVYEDFRTPQALCASVGASLWPRDTLHAIQIQQRSQGRQVEDEKAR